MNSAASALSLRAYASPKAVPFASVVAFRNRVVSAPLLRPVWLARGSVVRIGDGAGTLVHVHEGIVWITEEHSRRDVFLVRRQVHRVANEGLTIVHADRDSRITLEFSRGGGPRSVEIAPAEDGSLRTGPSQAPGGRATLATLVDAVRRLRNAFVAWWNAPREASFGDAWPRRSVHWQENDFTPESVRARLLNSSPFPFH